MNSNNIILNKINAFLSSIRGYEIKSMPNSTIRELDLDSLEFINLFVMIEDEFGFTFTNDDLILDNYKVIQDIINIVLKRAG